jgi:heme-degrading monooxygenase HmoA
MVPALDTGDGSSSFELMHAHKAGQKQAHPDRAIIGTHWRTLPPIYAY